MVTVEHERRGATNVTSMKFTESLQKVNDLERIYQRKKASLLVKSKVALEEALSGWDVSSKHMRSMPLSREKKVGTKLSKEDNLILQMLSENREAAIKRIHSCYGKGLLLTANGILRNAQDAEECVNDVLMRLWSHELPNGIESLEAYLAKMVRNQAIMYLRTSLFLMFSR